MNPVNSHMKAGLAVAAIVLLAGCLQAEYDVYVTNDGEIDRAEIEVALPAEYEEEIDQQGIVEEVENGYAQRDIAVNDTSIEKVEEQGNASIYRITVEDFSINESSPVDVYEQNDTVVYEDTNPVPSQGDLTHYRVHMPGEINDTNAQFVDGNTAIYNETSGITEIYVRSQKAPGFLQAIIDLIAGIIEAIFGN